MNVQIDEVVGEVEAGSERQREEREATASERADEREHLQKLLRRVEERKERLRAD